MNIFFDMDYTLLSFDGTLRPLTFEVFHRLRQDGHRLYIWSGVGVRTHEVTKLGLAPFVQGVYQKPIEQFEQGLARYSIPLRPDFVVDDHKEIVDHFGGFLVRPYFWPDPHDRELERVYLTIRQLASRLTMPEDRGTRGLT